MKRTIGVLTVALFMLGLLAGPAAAVDAGVFGGTAVIGKEGTCNNPSGPGIGLPMLGQKKNAWWSIDTRGAFPGGVGFFTGVNVLPPGPGLPGSGVLVACGALQNVGKPPVQIGAACGMSKGHSGTGSVTMTDGPKANQVYLLNDLGWKATAGGTLPVTGRGPGNDLVTALVQAQGAGPCLTKVGDGNGTPKTDNSGATSFTVVGTFARVPGAYTNPNAAPLMCKDGSTTCLYEPKKTPNS